LAQDENSSFDPKLDSFVWGVESISEIINRTPRQTYYLAEQRLIDCDKVGGRWRSTPRRLLQPGDKAAPEGLSDDRNKIVAGLDQVSLDEIETHLTDDRRFTDKGRKR
jgi:hypothetical protein